MHFDVDTLIKLASLILSVGAIIYAFFANRKKDVEQQFEHHSHQLKTHESRLSSLEQSIKTMPNKDDVHHLQIMLSDMGGELKAMRATMKGMAESQNRLENIVTRHEDHLRENK